MDIPDVIGYSEEEGINELTQKGYLISNKIIIKPLNAKKPVGISRIIRINKIEDKNIEVMIAYQDYEKGGVL